jgi:hypothetical protein
MVGFVNFTHGLEAEGDNPNMGGGPGCRRWPLRPGVPVRGELVITANERSRFNPLQIGMGDDLQAKQIQPRNAADWRGVHAGLDEKSTVSAATEDKSKPGGWGKFS